MRPLICNYKLHSIKHVCHTDFSARTLRRRNWGDGMCARESERDWQSICTLTTITDFRHFKGFYKLPFALSPQKKFYAAAPTLAICFGLFPCPHTHTAHSHTRTAGHMCFLFSSWLRLPCTTLINSMCDSWPKSQLPDLKLVSARQELKGDREQSDFLWVWQVAN